MKLWFLFFFFGLDSRTFHETWSIIAYISVCVRLIIYDYAALSSYLYMNVRSLFIVRQCYLFILCSRSYIHKTSYVKYFTLSGRFFFRFLSLFGFCFVYTLCLISLLTIKFQHFYFSLLLVCFKCEIHWSCVCWKANTH